MCALKFGVFVQNRQLAQADPQHGDFQGDNEHGKQNFFQRRHVARRGRKTPVEGHQRDVQPVQHDARDRHDGGVKSQVLVFLAGGHCVHEAGRQDETQQFHQKPRAPRGAGPEAGPVTRDGSCMASMSFDPVFFGINW